MSAGMLEAAAELAAEAADTDTVKRAPGCQCQREEGDSECPVHDEDEGGARSEVVLSPSLAGLAEQVRQALEPPPFENAVEEVRAITNMVNCGPEDWYAQWDLDSLRVLCIAHRRSAWDFLPHQWALRQVFAAVASGARIVPKFDRDDERPVYETPLEGCAAVSLDPSADGEAVPVADDAESEFCAFINEQCGPKPRRAQVEIFIRSRSWTLYGFDLVNESTSEYAPSITPGRDGERDHHASQSFTVEEVEAIVRRVHPEWFAGGGAR